MHDCAGNWKLLEKLSCDKVKNSGWSVCGMWCMCKYGLINLEDVLVDAFGFACWFGIWCEKKKYAYTIVCWLIVVDNLPTNFVR